MNIITDQKLTCSIQFKSFLVRLSLPYVIFYNLPPAMKHFLVSDHLIRKFTTPTFPYREFAVLLPLMKVVMQVITAN